jgi:hypothetical protein
MEMKKRSAKSKQLIKTQPIRNRMSWTPEELMTYVRNKNSNELGLTSFGHLRCPTLRPVELTDHELKTLTTLGYTINVSNWMGFSGRNTYHVIAPENIDDAVPPTTRADVVDDALITTFRQLRAWFKYANTYLRHTTVMRITEGKPFTENLTPCEQRSLKAAGFTIVRVHNGFNVHPPSDQPSEQPSEPPAII